MTLSSVSNHTISSRGLNETSSLKNYLIHFDQLKKNENWIEIIQLGSQALLDPFISLNQKAKIHAQLASCSFYLGDYENCLSHAQNCLSLSEKLDDSSLVIRAFYLLSAHKRAEGNQYLEINPKLSKHYFEEARSLIDQALEHLNYCSDDFMKAKVLFNAAAADSDDPYGNLERAIERYQKAIEIYTSLRAYDDVARASIRLAKVYLLQKRYKDLLCILKGIDVVSLPLKTKVHYQYLEAQYYASLQQPEKAKSILQEAIETAENLKMETDLKRLEALMSHLS